MKESTAPTAFDWAARRGDRWRTHLRGMEAMLAPVDAPLLEALDLDAPLRIVDVACGGGGTTLELARRVPAGSVVCGVDISPGLIDVARGRVTPEMGPIKFTVSDISKDAPPEGPFDRILSRFGVMFFDDAPAAFANLARWLTPTGRFAFAVWGPLPENPWVDVVRDVISRFIALPPAGHDAPGPFRYGQADALVALLTAAGFGGLRVSTWHGELELGGGLSPADATDFALASFSVADAVMQADDATRAQVRSTLTERFSQQLQNGVVRLASSVHLITGGRAPR